MRERLPRSGSEPAETVTASDTPDAGGVEGMMPNDTGRGPREHRCRGVHPKYICGGIVLWQRQTYGGGMEVDAWEFTDVVTRLRRILRASVRGDVPWESLPMAQVELLQRLDDEPDLRVSDLAVRHRLAPNTVSTLVAQLVDQGLVERHPDPRDRRAVTVSITGAGRARLHDWLAAHEHRLAEALAALDRDDRRVVIASLGPLARLVDRLERLDEEGRREVDEE